MQPMPCRWWPDTGRRSPLPGRGRWGKITLTPLVLVDGKWVTAPEGVKPTKWRARARLRDESNRVHTLEATARQKAAVSRFLVSRWKSNALVLAAVEGGAVRP